MKQWMLLADLILCSACQLSATPDSTPSVVEVPLTEPFVEPTATPVCQPANGVNLDIVRLRDTTIRLNVTGRQPGKKPSLIYSTSIAGEASTMGEMYNFAEGADEQGAFSVGLPGLRPLEGQTNATWDIRFIQSRGVECAMITLP